MYPAPPVAARIWSFRYGGLGEPKVANGPQFDRRVLRDRGDLFEVERRYASGAHQGAIRLLSSLLHTDSGTYSQAIRLAEETHTTPDITLTRHPGNLKYGFGINAEQAITPDIGVFTRLGWNDGKTESFAFTAIDRIATGGVTVEGAVEAAGGYCRDGALRGWAFGGPCAVPCDGRTPLHHR